MTNLAELYGIETKTDEVEIIVGCDWSVVIYVTDSSQQLDLTLFNAYCRWATCSHDNITIPDSDRLIALNSDNIVPTERAGNYDVQYLIELLPAQTETLIDLVGRKIYGDVLITDNTNSKMIRRFKALVRGAITQL